MDSHPVGMTYQNVSGKSSPRGISRTPGGPLAFMRSAFLARMLAEPSASLEASVFAGGKSMVAKRGRSGPQQSSADIADRPFDSFLGEALHAPPAMPLALIPPSFGASAIAALSRLISYSRVPAAISVSWKSHSMFSSGTASPGPRPHNRIQLRRRRLSSACACTRETWQAIPRQAPRSPRRSPYRRTTFQPLQGPDCPGSSPRRERR